MASPSQANPIEGEGSNVSHGGADLVWPSQRARRLQLLKPADDLKNRVESAGDDGELTLEDGTYRLSSSIVISKNIAISAENVGRAIIDGQGVTRIFNIVSGTVILVGLNITNGRHSVVDAWTSNRPHSSDPDSNPPLSSNPFKKLPPWTP